ncbi:MAG TPA: hypothetical protein VGJ91_19525 [Polyangiaceae bacterium]|jgi:hypothetical protein
MLAAALVVLVVGSGPAPGATTAFEAAARGVLGEETKIQIIRLDEAPSDEETVARANGVDGVVELIWSRDGTKTRIHCYVSREHRWVEREINFGANDTNAARDAVERGRLLGYAVATMFADESELLPGPAPNVAPPVVHPPRASRPDVIGSTPAVGVQGESSQPSLARRCLEFTAIASSGLGGTAAGLGASAGFRTSLAGPLSVRLFVAGRAGSVAHAQATTRDARFGGGLAIAAPFRERRFELGLRSDLFLSYFDATHLSEDDPAPDRRSRWVPGGDLFAEGGFHFTRNVGLFVGLGVEAMLGKTDLYTHGRQVAVVPVWRAVGEMGFRIGF